jgi:hypothetical protein
MAIDMGINRSFIHLLRTGMGAKKSVEELEDERYLVVNSRVWFSVYQTLSVSRLLTPQLYRLEHQMSYGLGRPAIIGEDETIHNCRRFLEHPLSLASDVRLVLSTELLAIRGGSNLA